MRRLSPILFFLFFSIFSNAQIDHYETAVFAENEWQFRLGFTEFPNNWQFPTYDDSGWATGNGGFGYGDDDDGTNIAPTIAVALRKTFTVVDVTKIERLVLSADYDDGFVAYLNGVELARANIGVVGTPPAFDEPTFTDHEADLYQGEQPEHFQTDQIADFLQNGENVLAIQVHNINLFSSDLSSNFYLSFGINDESNDYEDNPTWFNPPTPFESSNLPLVIIETNGQSIQDEPRIAAQMGIIDNGPDERNYLTDAFNDYQGQISIEIRGASSQSFPKKNYSLETQNPDSTNNNVSLLGMPEENDWVLHGPYSDKSLMRNMLTYDFVRNMGRYAPRTAPCELIINGEYRGVYVLMERIKRDENRVDIAKITPEDTSGDELTGGYLMQIDRDNGSINDGFTSDYQWFIFYAYDDPDYDEINAIQRSYIRNFIENFEDAMDAPDYEDTYRDYLDLDAFVDYVLATEITKHIDAYRLSFFMHKKKDSKGGKLHLGPIWDINLGYGNFDYACDNDHIGWAYEWHNDCSDVAFWLPKVAAIPNIQHKMKCRWEELRQGVWSTENLVGYIDSMAVVLAEGQERNFQKFSILGSYVWPNGFVGDTYVQEITFLKNWLSSRLTWMDANMSGDCSLVDAQEVENELVNWNFFPNPTRQRVWFESNTGVAKEGKIRFYDVLGTLIKEQEIRTDLPFSVDLAQEPEGIYFYEIDVEGQPMKKGSILTF